MSISILNYRLTEHALQEMSRRKITEDEVAHVLADPEQIMVVREGREVFQSRFNVDEPPKTYLIRVFVDIDRTPVDVVTAYRTSKIAKYWRTDE